MCVREGSYMWREILYELMFGIVSIVMVAGLFLASNLA